MGVHRNNNLNLLKLFFRLYIKGGTQEYITRSKIYFVSMEVHSNDDESSKKLTYKSLSPQHEKFLYNNILVRQR